MDPQVRQLARRLNALEKARLRAKQPTLGFSTIEDGALRAVDVDQNTTMILGKQYDETFTAATVTGPVPATPGQPLVTGAVGGLTVYWDGYFEGGAVAPMDFARTIVYLVPDDGVSTLDPTDPAQAMAAFASAAGGEVFVPATDGVDYLVYLVSWSQAGKFSPGSMPGFGTPTVLVIDDTPTEPPTESPAITAIGFSDAILLRAQTVAASTLIEYHMRVADPDTTFVPTQGDPATLLGIPTRSAIQLVTTLPDGVTKLDLTASYEFATIATNVVDAAAPSASVEAKCDPEAITEQVMGAVAAGFALVGRITVGDPVNGIKIDPDKGIVIPQPDGGTITFPANGTDANITAHVTAKSLNVQTALTISGTGKIEGSVALSDGITRPSTAPILTKMWPRMLSGMGDGVTQAFLHWRDLAPHASDASKFVAAYSFYGAGIRSWNRADGSSGSFDDLTLPLQGTADDWMANFYLDGGICSTGGNYYVVGSDADRFGGWYLYKLNGSTMKKVDEVYIATLGAFPFAPKITTDGTALYIVYKNTSDNLTVRKHSLSTLTYLGQKNLITNWGGSVIGGVTLTTADTGTKRLYLSSENYGNVLAFNASDADFTNWTREATHDFQRADTMPVWGLEYENVDGRFITLDPYGYWHRYAKRPTAQAIDGEYTHADRSTGTYPAGHPNAGEASLTHETEAGPRVGYTIPARAWLHVETNPAPDANDTDPTHVDRADRIGLYLGPTGAPVLQGYLFQGNRTADFDVLSTGTTPAPTSNSFSSDPKVIASPGRIYSTRQAGGSSVIDLNGSGVWRLGHLKGNADGTDANDTGWQNVTFQNSWVNFGSPFGDVQYRKVKIGNSTKLVFQGMCKSGTLNATMFTLPVAYRPAVSRIVQVGLSNKISGAASTGTAHTHGIGNGSTRATIGSDGTVATVGADSSSYISFDGVEIWLD